MRGGRCHTRGRRIASRGISGNRQPYFDRHDRDCRSLRPCAFLLSSCCASGAGARLNELSLMAAGPERTVNALRYLCTVAGLTCLATAVGTRTHMEQGQ